jgi:ABC-type lipoprotein release transport system permease subunit
MSPEAVEPVVYQPQTPGQAAGGSLVLRVSGGMPATYVGRLRELTAAVDPTVRLSAYPLIDIHRQANVVMRLVWAALALVVFSVLLLSGAGIYAMMSFTIAQRRKEIAIRAALGADPRHLLWSVFARSAGQLASGVAVGIAAAILIGVLNGGDAWDSERALLLTVMSALMLTVGLLASVGPARRGLRIQPTEALRENR